MVEGERSCDISAVWMCDDINFVGEGEMVSRFCNYTSHFEGINGMYFMILQLFYIAACDCLKQILLYSRLSIRRFYDICTKNHTEGYHQMMVVLGN